MSACNGELDTLVAADAAAEDRALIGVFDGVTDKPAVLAD